MISRSMGIATALAASMTRAMSEGPTSPFLMATMPWLLSPWMCPPAMPAKTLEISQPAMLAASPTACLMAATVLSMWVTTPLRSPLDGAVPRPMTSIPLSFTSPTRATILVVPISSPTISSSRFAIIFAS